MTDDGFPCIDYLAVANGYCSRTGRFDSKCQGYPKKCCAQDKEQITEWKYVPKVQAEKRA